MYYSVVLPAECLENNSVCGLSALKAHEDLFWGSFSCVVEVQFGQVFGAQPEEDSSVKDKVGVHFSS